MTSHDMADMYRSETEFSLPNSERTETGDANKEATEVSPSERADVSQASGTEGKGSRGKAKKESRKKSDSPRIRKRKADERRIDESDSGAHLTPRRVPTISHTIRFKEPAKLRLGLVSRLLERSQDSIANEAVEDWLAENGYTESWYASVVATLPVTSDE